MRHLAMTAATVAAAVTLAACGSGTSSPTAAPATTDAMPMMTTAPTAAAGDHNQADVTFAQMMIPHHEQAIEMAKLASTQSSNGNVKNLATQIQDGQQPEIDQLKGWLTSWGAATTPNDIGHDMSNMSDATRHNMPGGMMSSDDMAKLEGLSGTEFDREFLTSMTAHHRGAIDQRVQALLHELVPARA